MNPKQSIAATGVLLVALYLGTYLTLSRMGVERAVQVDSDVYYFFEPVNAEAEQAHLACCYFYLPLTTIEQWLGCRYAPVACPGLKLS